MFSIKNACYQNGIRYNAYMLDSIYREEILDHYKNPQNFGTLYSFSHKTHIVNPFCGDELTLYVLIVHNRIEDIAFSGSGCAISIASASLLTEHCKGKAKETLTVFQERDMLKLLNIPVSETRKKCALLGFAALKDCIEQE